MDDDVLPRTNLEGLLPGMTLDFKDYVDVLPPEGIARDPREDPGVRELALHISRLIGKTERSR